MRLLFALAVLLIVGTPNRAFAFKWSKCKGNFKNYVKVSDKKGKLGDIFFQVTTEWTSQTSFQASSSTSSYVSSTGSCAAFAKADEERTVFIADSMVELKTDLAEGQGEHVSSLATLYGCEGGSRDTFIQMLRANHTQIFSGQNPEAVNDHILTNIENSPNINCNVERI